MDEIRSVAPPPSVGTEYDGPVVLTTMEFGGRPIRLVRPTDPDRMLDDPAVRDWNRRDDYMPYWAYLWPAAYLLAEAVAREPWPVDPEGGPIEALEIGCGLGLAGLAGLARDSASSFPITTRRRSRSSPAPRPRTASIRVGSRPGCSTGASCPTSGSPSSSEPT